MLPYAFHTMKVRMQTLTGGPMYVSLYTLMRVIDTKRRMLGLTEDRIINLDP